MSQLRSIMLAAVVALLFATVSRGGVMIDQADRHVYAATTNFGSLSLPNSQTGEWLKSASIPNEGFPRSTQHSWIEPSGHFYGSAAMHTASADAAAASGFNVRFTIDTYYEYSLLVVASANIASNFVHAQLFSESAGTHIEYSDGPGVIDSSGMIGPGAYQLFVHADARGVYGDTSQSFDFQLFDVQAHVVPEPASLAVWSCLALTAIGGAWWRKRRSI